jgi:hypothetical protein
MNVSACFLGSIVALAYGVCWADEQPRVIDQTRLAKQPNLIFIMADDLG